MRNLLWIAISLVLLLGAILGPWTPAPVQLAAELAGDARYDVQYLDTRVGHYQSTTRIARDRVVFETRMVTEFPGTEVTTIHEQLEFSARAPFVLLQASRLERTGAREQHTAVEHRGSGRYAVVHTRPEGPVHDEVSWQYALPDHLALELALAAGATPGARLTGRQLDLARLEPRARTWHIVAPLDDGGWWLRDGTPGEDVLVLVDARGMPHTLLYAAGLLTLTRSDGAQPVEHGTQLAWPGEPLVPLDTPIAQPLRLERVTLRVSERIRTALATVPELGWQPGGDGYWLLTITAERASTQGGDRSAQTAHRDGDMNAGRASPMIRRLKTEALAGVGDDTTQQVAALVSFVNGFLAYSDRRRPLDLFDAVTAREGSCTEFANLFTALAHAAGLSARTVTGLVYAEDTGPGFYVHAWNEVLVGDRWHSVDPTLGSTWVGATHIPFPAGDTAFLRAYAAFAGHEIEIRELIYAGS
jgi:hypothetical protein